MSLTTIQIVSYDGYKILPLACRAVPIPDIEERTTVSEFTISIAVHKVRIRASAAWIENWFRGLFPTDDSVAEPDTVLHVADGYGRPFLGYEVTVDRTSAATAYTRSDYRLRVAKDYAESWLEVRDPLALKHAMVHLYSALIAFRGWGVLIHSSGVADRGNAYLFAGRSGAGKSTVALMSRSRPVLSDEASLVCIPEDGNVRVYDSPFRSDSEANNGEVSYPLAAVHFLNQSERVERTELAGSDAFRKLMSAVFYWPHAPEETVKVIRLIETLASRVRSYDLFFQKNDAFWELIS